ncbi:hypothetical protein GCM10027418_23350 [Mariniluteicoccus endophyticus]
MGADKATLAYGAKTLLERAVDACARATHTVVVAPDAPADLRRVLEDPPFGGPVAGIDRGLEDLASLGDPAPWVLLLAVDYPEAPTAVARLLEAADDAGSHDAYAALDDEGVRQNLLALYRRESLVAAIERLGETRDVSVRRLVDGLDVCLVDMEERIAADVDDPEAARAYGIEVPHGA